MNEFESYCAKLNVIQYYIAIKNILAILAYYKKTFYPNFSLPFTSETKPLEFKENNNNSDSLENTASINNIESFRTFWKPIHKMDNNPFNDSPMPIRHTFFTLLEGFSIEKNNAIENINDDYFLHIAIPMEFKVLISWIKTNI
jgi:hypothetical protein